MLFPMPAGFEKGGFQGLGANGMTYDWKAWDGTPHGYVRSARGWPPGLARRAVTLSGRFEPRPGPDFPAAVMTMAGVDEPYQSTRTTVLFLRKNGPILTEKTFLYRVDSCPFRGRVWDDTIMLVSSRNETGECQVG